MHRTDGNGVVVAVGASGADREVFAAYCTTAHPGSMSLYRSTVLPDQYRCAGCGALHGAGDVRERQRRAGVLGSHEGGAR